MKTWIDALNARLVDDWHNVILKAWSVRIAALWGAMSGLLVVWPALADKIPTGAYVAGSVVMTALIAIARVTKQDGVE